MSHQDTLKLKALRDAITEAIELMASGRIQMAKDVLEIALGIKVEAA